MPIARLDGGDRRPPSGGRRHGFELPPVGTDTDRVEARDEVGRRRVIDGADLGRDDLQQKFQVVAAGSAEEPHDRLLLLGAHFR